MDGNCGCSSGSTASIGVTPEVTPKATSQKGLPLPPNEPARRDRDAEHNRVLFRHLLALNVLSSPGAGKTTLVQRLLQDRDLISGADPLKSHYVPVKAGVIVGDLAPDRDAKRLRKTGVPVVQINTGDRCYLEADRITQAAQQLDLAALNLLIIENVGNLICPAPYDLGEDLRLVLMSVTEGEDTALKYPTPFKSAHAIIINKIDIAEAIGFKRDEALRHLRLVAPQALIFELSATTGQGLASFYAYLGQAIFQCQAKMDPN
ncbi:MAG: hydrogenase nickel incorporation protein HypB [Leptolyngbya sp. SIO1E4]|nr:hydrogenase nickel incorporation protein HypB [Leptolyngbya sp. SIO1E4]